ncbi:MAG: phosphoglycerate dehydrogenase [bacterium]|jgi:D-3-phosphoglycerate dehydrogenase
MVNTNKTSYPKDKIKILMLENISDAAIKVFKDAGYADIKKISGALSEDQLINEIKHVHMVGIRSKTQITEKVLQHAEKLQAIGCFCIGTNQVNLQAARKKGIVVFNAPYSNTRSVAELVVGASIILIRKILDKNKAAHEGNWNKDAKGSFEIRGKTLGIIGYGNIGSQVSILAEALGMKVIFYDTITKLPLGNAESRKTIKDVVSKADIITLHIPETQQTKNLINKTLLKQFKKGSILINFARGEVVDLEALTVALTNGHLSGAAIDVFPVEPEKNGDPFSSPLQNIPNVLLTPHIGGSTEEAQYNIGEDVSAKLLQYLEMGATTGSHTVPELSLSPQEGTHRILHIHTNVPGVLSEINTTLSENKINVLGQYLKTNDEIGYVVLDIDKKLSKNAVELLKKVKGSLKVRLLY